MLTTTAQVVNYANVPLLQSFTQTQKVFDLSTWSNNITCGSFNVHTGDFDGDGLDDLVEFCSGTWQVHLNDDESFLAPSTWQTNFGNGSSEQLIGDFNGDGKDDICVFFASTGVWEVSLSSGTGFGTTAQWQSGFGIGSNKQLVGDFDGDGKDDICVFFASSGKWEVDKSTGTNFGTWSTWQTGFGIGSDDQLVGDFDGDGKDDICGFINSTGKWEIALSSGIIFGNWGTWQTGFGIGSSIRLIGDFDGDGKDDASVFFRASGVIEVDISTGSSFTGWSTWHQAPANSIDNIEIGQFNCDIRCDFGIMDIGKMNCRVGTVLPACDQEIYLGKNDSESYFLLLSSLYGSRNGIKVTSQGFPSGINISFKHLGFILENNSSTKRVPDPLVPRDSIDLALNAQEYVLVEVATTSNAPTGTFNGQIIVTSNHSPTASLSVPLKINVWNFTLPQKPSLSTLFGIRQGDLNMVYGSTPLTEKAIDTWVKEFRKYRISTYLHTQENYFNSLTGLSGQPINDYITSQTSGKHNSTFTLGMPGNSGCEWPIFYDSPCIPGMTNAINQITNFHDAQTILDAFENYLSNLKSMSVPVPQNEDVVLYYVDEACHDPLAHEFTRKHISRYNCHQAGMGIGSNNQLVGDFDGDGKDDICAFFASSGDWEIALSNGKTFDGWSQWQSGLGIGSDNQLVGDFNGDGKDDIIIFVASSGVWEVSLSTGTGFGPWTTWVSGYGIGSSRQFVGDFDGDGKDDICVFVASAGKWEVSISSGTNFSSNWTTWQMNFGVGSQHQFVGDFSGDGKTDIGILNPGGIWRVNKSDGQQFVNQSLNYCRGFADAKDAISILTGDFNGDNLDDIVAVFENGEWYADTTYMDSMGCFTHAFCQATIEPFGYQADKYLIGNFNGPEAGGLSFSDVMSFRDEFGSWSFSLGEGIRRFTVPRDQQFFRGLRTCGPEKAMTNELKQDWALQNEGIGIWVETLSALGYGPASSDLQAGMALAQSYGDQGWSFTLPDNIPETPSFEVNENPLSAYLHAWYDWRNSLTGNLYWSTTAWRDPMNPLCPVDKSQLGTFLANNYSNWSCFTGNRDGILTYPGYKNGDPVFIPSYRLECFKHGVEDYDYFALLQYANDNLGITAAQNLLDKVETSTNLIGKGGYFDILSVEKKLKRYKDFRIEMGNLLSTISFPTSTLASVPNRRPDLRKLACESCTVSIDDLDQQLVNQFITLDPVSPNPFSNETTIKFSLQKNMQVELTILNSLGQRVTTLLNQRLDAKVHQLTWNGRNSSGTPVANGVYYLTLKADNINLSTKMVIIR